MFNKAQSSFSGGIVGESGNNGFTFDNYIDEITGKEFDYSVYPRYQSFIGYRPGIYNLKSQYNFKSLKHWAKKPWIVTYGETSSTQDTIGWTGQIYPYGLMSINNSGGPILPPNTLKAGDFVLWLTSSYATTYFPFGSSPLAGLTNYVSMNSIMTYTTANPPMQANYFIVPKNVADTEQYRYIIHPVNPTYGATTYGIRSTDHNVGFFYLIIRDLPANFTIQSLVGPTAIASAATTRPAGLATSTNNFSTYATRLRFGMGSQRTTSSGFDPEAQIYMNSGIPQRYTVTTYGYATRSSYLSVHWDLINPQTYSNSYTGSQLDYNTLHETSFRRAFQNFWDTGSYYEFDIVFNEY
jgi:hypothetical protein